MGEQAFNIKFVNEVEKHPELYNYKLKGYSKKDVTDKAWNDVAKEVQLTVNECKEKWKNLRSVFVRHIKPPPSGSSSKNKKPYYLSEAMKFTLPFIKTLGTPSGNLPEVINEQNLEHSSSDPTQNTEDVAAEEEEYISDNAILTTTPQLSLPSPMLPNTDFSQEHAHHSQQMTHDPFSNPKDNLSKRKKQTVTEVDKSFMEYMNAKKRKLESNSNDDRQVKTSFLLSLLPEIEPLTDAQMKSFRRRVLQLIDDITNPKDMHQHVPAYQQTPTYSYSVSTHSSLATDNASICSSPGNQTIPQKVQDTETQQYFEVIQETLQYEQEHNVM
ncbi:uncharacterized protein LOC134542872 [Bacillus rossius redtenbacheri]|uniref:uncharacterized protein LOC134541962 n=1 Tax=Bacillus rossius redtenbacheri TaxID=93214 RepID=UPI002FDEDB19